MRPLTYTPTTPGMVANVLVMPMSVPACSGPIHRVDREAAGGEREDAVTERHDRDRERCAVDVADDEERAGDARERDGLELRAHLGGFHAAPDQSVGHGAGDVQEEKPAMLGMIVNRPTEAKATPRP